MNLPTPFKISIRMTRGLDGIEPIHRLRYEVLRKPLGHPPNSAQFEGDERSTTIHFAAYVDSQIIGCVTILYAQAQSSGQLRGMAIDSAYQKLGIGKRLLHEVHDWASMNQLELWCKARDSAVGFYEKNGWIVEGELYEVDGVGPHVTMRWKPAVSL